MKNRVAVSSELKAQVFEKISECIKTFAVKTGYELKFPIVKYDLKGTTAGQAIYGSCVDEATIRVNGAILIDHTERYLNRTVPHEVAHLIVKYYYSRVKKLTTTPHGKMWKYTMMLLGVQDIGRCHSYSLRTEEVRRQRRFLYACPCKTFNLSTTRHNKIQSGRKYFCTDCQRLLVYQGEEL